METDQVTLVLRLNTSGTPVQAICDALNDILSSAETQLREVGAVDYYPLTPYRAPNGIRFKVGDDSRSSDHALEFRIDADACGVAIVALRDDGQPMVSAGLDYNYNVLQSVTIDVEQYLDGDGGHFIILSADVDAERKKPGVEEEASDDEQREDRSAG